jgi:triosephosphate isomerase
MKKPLIAANWKMNTTMSEALMLANGVKAGVRNVTGVDIVLCPPSLWIVPIKEALAQHPAKQLKLGAQNLFWQESGAYTGEVSAPMLRGLVDYVIIGHSERRKYFKESNEELHRKVAMALAAKLTPILCVGELKKPSDALLTDPSALTAGRLRNIIFDLDEALGGLVPTDVQKVVIAYEPVWAIGAVAATAIYAEQVTRLITEHIAKINGGRTESVKVLYGGSANEKNTADFLAQPHIDGLLVGGASLKSATFVGMCRIAQQSSTA